MTRWPGPCADMGVTECGARGSKDDAQIEREFARPHTQAAPHYKDAGAQRGVWQQCPEAIVLHPTLLGTSRVDPPAETWGCPTAHLGEAFAYDTLLHECVHLGIQQQHGGWGGEGESSHNNRFWIEEVNRLAPLLGLQLTAGRNKPTRVPVEGVARENGKPLTTVKRVCTGDVPFRAVAGFPRQCRYYLAFPEWWQARHLRGERLDYPDESVPRFYREPLPFLDEVQRPAERYGP